jgi:hypothetical protein
VAASQRRTELSSETDGSRWPSGENVTELTELVWLSSVRKWAPVAASQSCTVWLAEANASCRPSGENVTELT